MTKLPLYFPGMPSPLLRRRGLIKPKRMQMGDTADASWQMVQGDRTYTFDANMALADGAAAQAASGYSQYAGADGVVDFGGNQGVTVTLPSIADVTSITPQQARIDAVCVIDLTAIDISSGNETYRFCMVGSNDAAFGAGKVNCLAEMEIGKGASLGFTNGQDAGSPPAVGGSRYELPFTNEQNNVKFQFGKLFLIAGGTTPSVTYAAFVAVLPEP